MINSTMNPMNYGASPMYEDEQAPPSMPYLPVGATRTYAPTADRPGMSTTTLSEKYINDRGDTVDQAGNVLFPAIQPTQLRPVAQVMNDKITKEKKRYEDPASFLADVRSEAYNLANNLGMDPRSQEYSEFVEQTVNQGREAVKRGEFVTPHMPVDKARYVETERGIFDGVTGKLSTWDDLEGRPKVQPPQVPETSSEKGGTSKNFSQRQYERDVARLDENPNLINTKEGQIIAKRVNDFEANQPKEAREAAKEKREQAEMALKEEEAKRKNEKLDRGTQYGIDNLTQTISLIDKALPKVNKWTTGYGGLLSNLPTTDARTLKNVIEGIKSRISFDELQKMRNASPTGGALGSIAVRELELLESSFGKIDQLEDVASLVQTLNTVKESSARLKDALKESEAMQSSDPMVKALLEKGLKPGSTFSSKGKRYQFTGTSIEPVQ